MLTYAKSNSSQNLSLTIDNLSQAIYIVNRHAKTAPNPKFLYHMKKEALQKMINEGKAKKIGLHFSDNPRNSQQQSDVLVECGKYLFHIPPVKTDFSELPHLGKLDEKVRNPKATFSLNQAKGYLLAYTGFSEPKEAEVVSTNRRNFQKPVFKKLGEKY